MKPEDPVEELALDLGKKKKKKKRFVGLDDEIGTEDSENRENQETVNQESKAGEDERMIEKILRKMRIDSEIQCLSLQLKRKGMSCQINTCTSTSHDTERSRRLRRKESSLRRRRLVFIEK